MNDFTFVDMNIDGITYRNNVFEEEMEVEVNIEVNIEYQMAFDEDSKMGFGSCEIMIEDENYEDLFTLNISTTGVFSYTAPELTDDLRKRYHKESIEILNPMWRDTILKITELAGIPPIVLEDLEVDEDEIRIDGVGTLN